MASTAAEVIADLTLREVDAEQYDLLLLPGGKAPEQLRHDEHALEIAKRFFSSNKPVAAICHGPQILLSARLLEGRRATCDKSVAQQLTDGGALMKTAKSWSTATSSPPANRVTCRPSCGEI